MGVLEFTFWRGMTNPMHCWCDSNTSEICTHTCIPVHIHAPVHVQVLVPVHRHARMFTSGRVDVNRQAGRETRRRRRTMGMRSMKGIGRARVCCRCLFRCRRRRCRHRCCCRCHALAMSLLMLLPLVLCMPLVTPIGRKAASLYVHHIKKIMRMQ